MCCPMVRTLLKMRGRGDYSETYGYAEGLGVKTVGFRSNAPAGPPFGMIGIIGYFHPEKRDSGAVAICAEQHDLSEREM
ncbi:MAG: hypothetical protein CSH36_10895 [Thalassolituus sp.]|nr:MAG: hypothetical protein CSH36_10895 [Thalassolituus sp.]